MKSFVAFLFFVSAVSVQFIGCEPQENVTYISAFECQESSDCPDGAECKASICVFVYEFTDSDGDGVADNMDACPVVRGDFDDGCPSTTLDSECQEDLDCGEKMACNSVGYCVPADVEPLPDDPENNVEINSPPVVIKQDDLEVEVACVSDLDGDGWVMNDPLYFSAKDSCPAGSLPDGEGLHFGDCNDSDPQINPDALEDNFDRIDNNCDGRVDEGWGSEIECLEDGDCADFHICEYNMCVFGHYCISDHDGDGWVKYNLGELLNNERYYVVSYNYSCPEGTIFAEDALPGDCDDFHSSAHSDANEICDLLDNDCDGIVDEGC